MGLINWGVRVIDNVEKDVRLIGQRLGYIPLSWRQVVIMNPAKDGILWRVPDPQVPMASSLAHTQALLVVENEQVMVLRNGVLQGGMEHGVILPPGLYDFSRVQMREQLEIIWTTTRELRLRWGVSDVLTSDGISIGASGYYSAVIEDPEELLRKVVGNNQVYKEEQLATFAKPDVASVVRDLMARMTVKEFQLARQEFIHACHEMLQPIFEQWGMEFLRITIENQNIPEQYRQAAAGRTIVTMEKEAQIEGAKADLTLAQLGAQAEAVRLRALNRVEIETMQAQLEMGLDPVELKKIGAIEILAANPAEGSLVDNRPQVVNQILTQPSNPPIMPVTVMGQLVPAGSPQVTPSLPPGHPASGPLASQPTSPAATGGAMTREKIQEMLDRLDERLISGEISEQKHSELYGRLQQKRKELP